MKGSVARRIAARIRVDGDCWIFTGCTKSGGYGQIRVAGFSQGVHRVVYELRNGAISSGIEICHSCDRPACCKPSHLFAGSHQDNMSDMKAKGRARFRLGSEHPRTKYPRELIALAKGRLAAGQPALRVAKECGINPGHIYSIKSGRSWRHVMPSEGMAELREMG